MSERVLSAERGSERLAERRRRSRRRMRIALGIFFLLFCAVLIWGLQKKSVRIENIQIVGDDQSLVGVARSAMQGSYFGIIPRDSIFFLPIEQVRASILAGHPEMAAVSIARDGLRGLSIKIDDRAPIARWCGDPANQSFLATSTPKLAEKCYLFDANGFVYATTSMTVPMRSFIVYESLVSPGQHASSTSIVGMTLPNAEKFPDAFDFARQLSLLGSPVVSIVFHDGEVDQYLENGVRISYVMGNEQNAFNALASARANFNAADESLEYIDLRFPGKVYLKRKK